MPENTPRVDVRSIAVRMTLQAVLEAQGLVTDVIEVERLRKPRLR